MPISGTYKISQLLGKIPLRIVLVVPFVIQTVGAVGIVGYLSFKNGQEAVNNVASQLRQEITNRIGQNLITYLHTPHQINQSNAVALINNELTTENIPKLQYHFWQQISIFNSVNSIVFGSESKEFIGVESRDTLVIMRSDQSTGYNLYTHRANNFGKSDQLLSINENYDPRGRPWYQAAVQAGKATWSEIFPQYTTQNLNLAAVQPFYDNQGNLIGVLNSSLHLVRVGDFLRSLKIGKTGQSFIIDRSGMLVATSTTEKPARIVEKKAKRFLATDSNNVLTKATSQYLVSLFGDLKKVDHTQQITFKINRQKLFVQILPINDNKGLDWLIVVVIPEADFMEQINANTQATIGLCLVALVMATLVGIATSIYIVQPILRLKDAATSFSSGQFDRTINLQRSDELGVLATAFNTMASQLQTSFHVLAEKNLELQKLDRLKDEFLANTSHELRTPLNGIIGIAESLIDGATGELPNITKSNLKLIISSGRRLASLVNDILDFSKLKHERLELQLKPLDLQAIAHVVISVIQPLAKSKNLQLINAIPDHLPPALGDENRLQQILYNLIGNAIKFTPSGHVEVSALVHPDQDYLMITVSDTGIGIASDKFERIFASFEQVEGSIAREYGGTGLGLTVTKQLVELHGGTISVESQIGVGSKFTFTLPISQIEIQEIAPVSIIQSPHIDQVNDSDSGSSFSPLIEGLNIAQSTQTSLCVNPVVNHHPDNIKILIVDDEPINLQVLINNLSLENYVITQASNGEDAIDIIEKGLKPDIILLDVMMPKMTGYEVTKKLRERYHSNELPIILLTAKTQIQDIVTGLNAGANDYLGKPVAKDELLARIRTQINMSRLQAENIRMSAELDVSRKLQTMILPKPSELAAIQSLDIAGFMETATEVGGDYYDVLPSQNGIKIGIGDVTGHGLESGMLLLMAQTAVRTLLESNQTDAVQFFDILNRTLYGNIQRMEIDKNMTLVLLDYVDGVLTISGQHEEVIIVRANGEVQQIDTVDLGFPIGLIGEISDLIACQKVTLQLNDVVVLYTDGITEAENLHHQQYGLNRLLEIVKNNYQHTAHNISEAVINDVREFIGKQQILDDLTLIVIKRKD